MPDLKEKLIQTIWTLEELSTTEHAEKIDLNFDEVCDKLVTLLGFLVLHDRGGEE